MVDNYHIDDSSMIKMELMTPARLLKSKEKSSMICQNDRYWAINDNYDFMIQSNDNDSKERQ